MEELAASMRRRPVYDFSDQVGHLLRRAYQRHVALFQDNMPDARLTGAQFSVLCALRDYGAVSMSEIGRATAIDQATVRGIVERLKAKRLIATSADAIDRRKVIVMLEADGAALLDAVTPAASRVSELTLAPLEAGEQEALVYLLRKITFADSGAHITEGVDGLDQNLAPSQSVTVVLQGGVKGGKSSAEPAALLMDGEVTEATLQGE